MPNRAPVIIIDDDAVTRLMLSTALKAQGLQTLEAESGEIGLQLFEEHGAEAILLDVLMPSGMDGYATCAEFRIRLEGEHLPILVMTGLEDEESINRAYEVGATDFITKPLNLTLLTHRLRYILRANDTTKRLLESESRLHRMAYFDTLTELPNRHFFYEHLQQMISVCKRKHLRLAILFLDLDNFKRINDTLGHHIGDLVLQETAKRLRNSIRTSDMMVRNGMIQNGNALARLGGDEFTVLLSFIENVESAAVVAERIRLQLKQPYILDDQELFTSTSVGIAVYPDNGETASDLLKNADMAMYYSKRDGGNCYSFFSPEMTRSAMRKMTLEKHLRKAMEKNELDVYYQPQMDMKSGHFTSVEAFIRWNNDELGSISPVELIPLAEDTGLIIGIGEWVLRHACTQAKQWLDQGMPLTRIAVNISSVQLLHHNFPTVIKTILQETGLNPEALELELTEITLIENEGVILEALKAIKQIGVQLAIDDFGTGYSSLNRLLNYPIDRLKIDQVFVCNLENDDKNGAIASAVIALSDSLGMKVTAEGVETRKQLSFLKEKFCTEAQGFFLSKPLPAEQVFTFFKESVSSAQK